MSSEVRTERRPQTNFARVVVNAITGSYIVFAGVHLLRDLLLR